MPIVFAVIYIELSYLLVWLYIYFGIGFHELEHVLIVRLNPNARY